MKQTWEQMAEELRMEIEQWQNPIMESIVGAIPIALLENEFAEEPETDL